MNGQSASDSNLARTPKPPLSNFANNRVQSREQAFAYDLWPARGHLLKGQFILTAANERLGITARPHLAVDTIPFSLLFLLYSCCLYLGHSGFMGMMLLGALVAIASDMHQMMSYVALMIQFRLRDH